MQNGTTLDIEINNIVNKITSQLKIDYIFGKDGYFILGLLNNFYTKVFQLDDSNRILLYAIQNYILGFLCNYDKFDNDVAKWIKPNEVQATNKILINNGTDHVACLGNIYDYKVEDKLHISIGKFINHCIKKMMQNISNKSVLIDELYRIILLSRFEQLIDGDNYIIDFSESSTKNAELICSSQI